MIVSLFFCFPLIAKLSIYSAVKEEQNTESKQFLLTMLVKILIILILMPISNTGSKNGLNLISCSTLETLWLFLALMMSRMWCSLIPKEPHSLEANISLCQESLLELSVYKVNTILYITGSTHSLLHLSTIFSAWGPVWEKKVQKRSHNHHHVFPNRSKMM